MWAQCCLQQEIEVTLGKTVCFRFKVIIGHVVKELVTNTVNAMNELVPALLPVLLSDKFINATADNFAFYVFKEGCCSTI